MSSAALVEAALAFLPDDVSASVNAEKPGLLVPGAVTAARAKRRGLRRDKPFAASVEIVLVTRRDEAEGIGVARVNLDFDLRCALRQKDTSEGAAQAAVVEYMARALVRRYEGVSNLPIAAVGASFRYAQAHVRVVDESPEQGELARSVVRLTLTFSEPLAENA
jgi:hypothetical protein